MLFSDPLFPGICLLCDARIPGPMDLCGYCRESLPWNNSACSLCALPLRGQHSMCADCAHRPPAWQKIVAPLRYAEVTAGWIHQLKFNDGLVQARLVSQLLLEAIDKNYEHHPLPDFIIPVPLSWQRLLRRGFNQSTVLARPIAKRLKKPLLTRAAKRLRHTAAQQSLSRTQRTRNLAGAFHCKRDWHGATVAIVDDVMTTGATLALLTNVLLQTNAGAVHVWCATRTPAP